MRNYLIILIKIKKSFNKIFVWALIIFKKTKKNPIKFDFVQKKTKINFQSKILTF